MATAEFELSLYKLLDQLRTKLEHARDTERAARSATRDIRAFFEADAVGLAEYDPVEAQLSLPYSCLQTPAETGRSSMASWMIFVNSWEDVSQTMT